MSAPVWRVPLPRGAEPPYRVFVSGVPQQEGRDYIVKDRELRFSKPLRKEERLGFWRWTLMFFSIAGTYGKNDSVDVEYGLGGARQLAVGLDIVAPDDEQKP